MKKEVQDNLEKLKADAAKDVAKELDLITIMVMDTGGVEAWLNAGEASYGAWNYGAHGQVIAELPMTREQVLAMDTDALASKLTVSTTIQLN